MLGGLRYAFGGWRLAVCVWWFAFGGWRVAVSVWRLPVWISVLRLAFWVGVTAMWTTLTMIKSTRKE